MSTLKNTQRVIGMKFNTDSKRMQMLLERYFTRLVVENGKVCNADEYLAEHCQSLAEKLTAANGCRGVLMMGSVGSGKTTLMKALQKLMAEINWTVGLSSVCNVDTDGMRIVRAKNIQRDGERWQYFDTLCREPLLGIDDLGAEPTEQLVFGNASTPVVDLLEERYDRRLFTVATTNLTFDKLEKKYGARITDRMNEMFRLIIFKNKSYR